MAAAAFSSKTFARLMYLRITTIDRCPVSLANDHSEQPRRAAVVTNPSLSECPESRSASTAAAIAARFTTRATVSPSVRSGSGVTVPIDASKQRPAGDPCRPDPRLERPHRVGFRRRAKRDRLHELEAFLVDLPPAHGDQQPRDALLADVSDVERGHFGCAGNAPTKPTRTWRGRGSRPASAPGWRGSPSARAWPTVRRPPGRTPSLTASRCAAASRAPRRSQSLLPSPPREVAALQACRGIRSRVLGTSRSSGTRARPPDPRPGHGLP